MERVPPGSELELLLREERWLRRLAGRLVADPGSADDLVQDTWIAALESRVRGRLSRAWLATVARNLWRDRREAEAQRRRREVAAARAEALEPGDALTAELELRQRVGRCLLELEEPYRRALVLRFLREQPLRELARAEGISVTRAHERVEEGLARLRRRLDGAHDGARERWLPALALLARRPGGAALGVPLVVLGGLTAAGLALGVFLVRARAPAPGAEPELAAPSASASGDPRTPVRAQRTPLGQASLGDAVRALETDRGLLLDLEGRPLAGIEVLSGAGVRVSDRAGRFALPAEFEGELRARGPELATLVSGAPRAGERVVVVGPARELSGRVYDEEGTPVAGARLAYQLRERLFRELGLVRPGGAPPGAWGTRSDAEGRFTLAGVVLDGRAYLACEAEGFIDSHHELDASGRVELVLTRDREQRSYVGRVLDADGQPRGEALVSAGERILASASDGSFRLAWSGPPGEAWLSAAFPGSAPARVALASLAPEQPFELRLGRAPATIRGRVVGPAGLARNSCWVWVRDLTPLGRVLERPGDESGAFQEELMLEEHSGGGRCATRTEADGSFELGGLLEREYELWVQAEVDGTRGGPWRVRAGRSEVVLRLEPEADTGPVSGRVLGLDGRPLVGVRVVPWRGASRDTYEHPPWLEETRARTTDADGRFSFPSFARTDTWLELRHPALFRPRFALDAAPDPTRLELTVPVLCEFELEPTPRSEACDALVVLDARGQELELCFASGEVTALLRTVPLRAGRSGVLRVPEDARTLVLRRGDEELLRLPLTLDPATRTRLAP